MEPRRGFLTQPGTLFYIPFQNFSAILKSFRDNLLYQLTRQTYSKMI